jgi:hypothetical protein
MDPFDILFALIRLPFELAWAILGWFFESEQKEEPKKEPKPKKKKPPGKRWVSCKGGFWFKHDEQHRRTAEEEPRCVFPVTFGKCGHEMKSCKNPWK